MILFLVISIVLLLLVIAIKVAPGTLVAVISLALLAWFFVEVAARSPGMQ